MKASLIMGALLLGLLVGGCNSNQGPAGPQGQPGPQGASSQDRDRDRDRDRDKDRDQGRDADRARQDQPPSCPKGEHPSTDNGRTTCVRD